MLLFVGLGNPTPDSENNRHNVGFKIIDSINKKFSLSKQKPKFKGLLTTGNIDIADYVLQNFDEDETLGIEKISKNITESISILVEKKLDLFSSTVNNK